MSSLINNNNNNGDELSSDELLKAQSLIWNHLFNFINSFSLKCALQLGIPDIVHKYGKPMPLSLLVEALHIHKEKMRHLQRLMSILIHSGFFLEIISEGYILTPASHLLLKDNPLSVTPFFLSMLNSALTDPWHQLSNWFIKIEENNVTPFEAFHGSSFWDLTGDEPQFNHHFNEGMAADARLVSCLVVRECKDVFEGVNSLVDVGGGTGTMAKAIANAFPGLSCIVLDLPHVVDGLQGSSNVSFVAGDMFESVPPADAIVLKWILHDWSDERCVEILRNCREATQNKKNDGKVIIIDMVVDKEKEDNDVETQLFFDMLMMVLTSGRERTEKDWAKLFYEAGFKSYKITPVLGLRSLIEVCP